MATDILDRDPSLSPKVGMLYNMMVKNRQRLLEVVEGIHDDLLDYTPDTHTVESIGTLLLHIAAVEWGFFFYNLDKRETDNERWKYAFANRDDSLNQLTGKGLKFYLYELLKVRNDVYERFKLISDEDLQNIIEDAYLKGSKYSIEWMFYHIIEHEAQHVGQILLLKRLYKTKH